MGTRTSRYLIKQFYLPLICLGLLIAGGFSYGWKEQVRFQKIDTLLQSLNHLEFSLVQVKEVTVASSLKDKSHQLNAVEYCLDKAIVQLVGLEFKNDKEEAFLFRLQEAQHQLNGREVSRGEDYKKLIGVLENMISENAAMTANLQKQMARVKMQKSLALSVGIGGFVFLLLYVLYFLMWKVRKPLKVLEKQAEALVQGQEGFKLENGNSLLFDFVFSNFSQHRSHLTHLAQLADQIGEGNFNQAQEEFEKAGTLGRSIGRMREKIQASFRDEEKRRWANEGLSGFSDLVREFSHDPDALCPKFLSELIPFIKANQGGLFLAEKVENQQIELQLKASFAWGRHKQIKKSYWIGEGLIGQVALDKDMVLLTDVPEDFVTIGSGLGGANPGCILILPLVAGEELLGVLELASFAVFEEHQIGFLKRVCEVLASSIAMAKGNKVTRQLLEKAENANLQLKAQEEELRQNTEELMSTQEAMMRKEAELSGLFASINYNMLTAEVDQEGCFGQLNEKLINLLGGQEKDYLAQSVCEVIRVPGWSKKDYEDFLTQLKSGVARNIECCLKKNEKTWLSASFTPVKNKAGELIKIMLLAYDISEKKEAEDIYKTQAEEIKVQEEQLRIYTTELESLQANLESRLKEATKEMERQIQEIESEKTKNGAILEGCVDGVISFNEIGQIEYFNKAAEEIWEISREEAIEKNIQDFIPVEIMVVDEELLVYYSKNGGRKILDARTEVPVKGKAGQEMEVLLTLTRVKVEGAYTFTAFAQKVAVELF